VQSKALTKDEAAADATLIVVGATDTSVQTVLTFLRYICADKTSQQRLQKELRDVFSGEFEDVPVDTLMRLPYLDACVQEALRIMPPGPFGTLYHRS
jgi:cytochrome P450